MNKYYKTFRRCLAEISDFLERELHSREYHSEVSKAKDSLAEYQLKIFAHAGMEVQLAVTNAQGVARKVGSLVRQRSRLLKPYLGKSGASSVQPTAEEMKKLDAAIAEQTSKQREFVKVFVEEYRRLQEILKAIRDTEFWKEMRRHWLQDKLREFEEAAREAAEHGSGGHVSVGRGGGGPRTGQRSTGDASAIGIGLIGQGSSSQQGSGGSSSFSSFSSSSSWYSSSTSGSSSGS